jgi:glycosyltransferase involved in cell wall biosynthesis
MTAPATFSSEGAMPRHEFLRLTEFPLGKTGWPWIEESPTNRDRLLDGKVWPRITIVTPSFNQGQYIEETIRSVLLQNYPNLEYIIIDGGSTDNSVEIIRRYESRLAYWVSEKDNGQAHAINKGFKKATGEWVGWINSDDFLLPGALQSLMCAAGNDSRVKWLGGDVRFIHDGEGHLDSIRPQGKNQQLSDWLLVRSHFHQPGTIWKRSLFAEFGFLNERMHYAFDWEFWCRLAANDVRPKTVDFPVASFRMHDASKTCMRWDRFCAENETIVATYLPRFSGLERRRMEERRTSLVCTRIRHESDRLLLDFRSFEVFRRVLVAIFGRPKLLLKKTPYLVLLRSGLASPLARLFRWEPHGSKRAPTLKC